MYSAPIGLPQTTYKRPKQWNISQAHQLPTEDGAPDKVNSAK